MYQFFCVFKVEKCKQKKRDVVEVFSGETEATLEKKRAKLLEANLYIQLKRCLALEQRLWNMYVVFYMTNLKAKEQFIRESAEIKGHIFIVTFDADE